MRRTRGRLPGPLRCGAQRASLGISGNSQGMFTGHSIRPRAAAAVHPALPTRDRGALAPPPPPLGRPVPGSGSAGLGETDNFSYDHAMDDQPAGPLARGFHPVTTVP